MSVPNGEHISPAAINPIPDKSHPLEAIVPNPRYPTFLHPFWTLVPPLVPNNNSDSICSLRGALQVSPLSTSFRSEVLKLLDNFLDVKTLSSHPKLISGINNHPLLPPDVVREQLTTVPVSFPLTYIGPRTSHPPREMVLQSLRGNNFEPRGHPNNGFPVAELSSSIMQMQPPTGQQCVSPLASYDETFASITNRDSLVADLGILQASSYPPPHYYGGSGGMDPPDRPRGSGKGKGREGSWQEEERESREGSAGGSAGGNNEESGPSRRRTSKKTPMACHFCRKRKLKCDGVQPTCHTCAEKSLVCSYDEQIRRRGPGKKNRLAQQKDRQSSSSEAQQQPEPSSSSSSSLRPLGSINSPLVTLPRPPMPQYPYQLGTPPTGLESRIVSSRLASESRAETGRFMEEYPQRGVYTQPQPGRVQHPESYPQQQQPSTSYPEYQQSSYRDRDRDQPPPPPPQTYPHQQHYYRQDYPSTSAHSIQRHSYVEEEEIEYASEDDNTTSSRPGPPSPDYQEEPRRRGGDPWQR